MSLVVYNSQSRKKETFSPLEAGKVRMYCCGPTVYGLLHVGNFRGAVFYNLVRNWLEVSGFKVTYVYNFTDVDDKIINRAKEENVEAKEISERYIEEFKKDFAALKLRSHDSNPKVSDFMAPIISMVSTLVDNKKAYVVNGEVLFSIRDFPGYGKLSGRNPEELMAGARVEIATHKRDPLDFALWKPAKEGEPSWASPWGPGRPGWHIECSAMASSILGEQIDIHGGGMDLIFPHHENEIAQSEGATNKNFVKYWMHNNMINFSGQKMSKSLGNITTMRDFYKEHGAEIYKYLMLSAHYRSTVDFSDDSIDLAISGLSRVYSALSRVQDYISDSSVIEKEDAKFTAEITKFENGIKEALNDDFNTSEVFARIFEAVRLFNNQVRPGLKISSEVKGKAQSLWTLIQTYGKLMSLFQEQPHQFLKQLDDRLLQKKNVKREDIDHLVEQRSQARAQKDFAKSDELRKQLTDMGIAVYDLANGSAWEVAK
ncbi:MAG: cysteine--tRNA ligase [Pseudobdellovibrionaceae bacterium]